MTPADLARSAIVFVAISLLAAATHASPVAEQRALFKRVYPEVERGDWSLVEQLDAADRRLLESYVLWPELRATFLRANIDSATAVEIDGFLEQYGTLRAARELRYRYALHLAKSGDLGAFRRVYERYYQGQGIARLDCYALQAELDAGRYARVHGRAMELWLVGKSQVSECDPVFDYLDTQRMLGTVEYRNRYKLAIEARDFSLARWLAKRIDDRHVQDVQRWTSARSDPEAFLRNHAGLGGGETVRAQLVYATERLTYRDPEAALEAWRKARKSHGFSAEQRLRTSRHIALWMARDNLPGAYEQLAALPAAAQSDEVMRWRARTSLRNGEWQRLSADIEAMSPTERRSEEWRYWHAVALEQSGDRAGAEAEYVELAQERSYYGFLAADELGDDYALDHARLSADETMIAALEARPDIVRARELFLVGLDSRGRSEWDAVIRRLAPQQKLQAALLANRWGWHSRAIATAASLREYDDLSIRYPLAYQPLFEASASAARISPTWAYGIARSESLFMRDVRSSAGAIGLMQLMPATGREVARDIRLPYSGLATLTNPESNIRLGTTYLSQMSERYNGNQVLATAAYNAGPHRVDQWLPESGELDARIWIENIPFNETRKYVKRVLSAQAIFHWRMTGQVRRVSDELDSVTATAEELKLAAR